MNNKMDKDSAYKIIPCAVHDHYELAVMRKQKLQLQWRDTNGAIHDEVLLARDLETRNHEEFLVAESAEQKIYRIRLDRITQYRVC